MTEQINKRKAKTNKKSKQTKRKILKEGLGMFLKNVFSAKNCSAFSILVN